MISRSAFELFRLRLAQLWRDPFLYLLSAGNIALVCLTTFSGPLPASDGGFAWRELSLAVEAMAAWAFALFLALDRAGRLLRGLPALPLARDQAACWWTLAETVTGIALLLPGILLLLLVLPGGPGAADLALVALTTSKAAALAAVGGGVREVFHHRGGAIPAMIGLWILLFLPPLSWADPRTLLEQGGWNPASLAGAFLVWAGLWASVTAARGLSAAAGQPSGSPEAR